MLSLKNARRAGQKGDEEGFTLIELMVVILIIAILIAIAIPTFLGARQKAQDRAAQSDLRNALTAAKTGYVDTEDYTQVQLSSIEPSLTYVSGSSTGPKSISVNATKSGIGLAALADDNVCWLVYDSTDASNAGTTYGKVTGATSSNCNAPSAPFSGAGSDKW
jgi:type IV pilus assembly protein PilA